MTLLDTREPADYAAGHVIGAVNVGLQGRFAEYAGSVLPPDREIVLVGDPAAAAEAKLRLGRVGYDRVVGQLDDPGAVYAGRPDLVEASSRLTAAQLAAQQEQAGTPDSSTSATPARRPPARSPARRRSRWRRSWTRLAGLDADAPVVLYCGSGYRSQVAASVLRAAGFADVSDVVGGFTAWDGAGLPTSAFLVHCSDPLNREIRDPSLITADVTPTAAFYDRNHFPIPSLDADPVVARCRRARPASAAAEPERHRGPPGAAARRDARVRRQRPVDVRPADRGRAVGAGRREHRRVDRYPARRRARSRRERRAVSTS